MVAPQNRFPKAFCNWQCNNCQNVNYQSRSSCNSCGSNKPLIFRQFLDLKDAWVDSFLSNLSDWRSRRPYENDDAQVNIVVAHESSKPALAESSQATGIRTVPASTPHLSSELPTVPTHVPDHKTCSVVSADNTVNVDRGNCEAGKKSQLVRCGACGVLKGRDSFSPNQMKRTSAGRKCRICANECDAKENGREMPTIALKLSPDNPKESFDVIGKVVPSIERRLFATAAKDGEVLPDLDKVVNTLSLLLSVAQDISEKEDIDNQENRVAGLDCVRRISELLFEFGPSELAELYYEIASSAKEKLVALRA